MPRKKPQAASQSAAEVAPPPAAAADQPQAAEPDGLARAKELRGQVFRRLQAEGRWKSLGLDQLRDDMFRECRSKGMEREAAMCWVYGELDRLYPPLPPQEPAATEAADAAHVEAHQETGNADSGAAPDTEHSSTPVVQQQTTQINSTQERGNVSSASDAAEQQVPPPAIDPSRGREGLGQIPADWPELPPNASLSAEIAWVQAERLRIVEERPNGATVVRLERARSPAPSWAALSWLETSIRSYAKYVEVAAKATSTAQDEQDQAKRERMALDEVRALLAEMM